MAYNTRQLRREGKPPSGQLASPVPQYWNPIIEDFEDVIGNHGAPYAMLVGPNGQPISSSNALPVSDSAVAQALAQLATEGKLEQVRVLLEALASKAATETTLAQVLAKLSNDPATATNQQAAKAVLDALASKDFATQATLAQVLARLEAIEEQLDTGNAKVTLTGQIEEVSVFEGLALADTEWVMSQTIDVSQYTRAQVWINSTLNAPVEISIRRYASADAAYIVMTYEDGQWAASNHTLLQIPGSGAGRRAIVANTFWKWLNESPLPFPTLAFRVRTTEVATSGSLSIYIRGVRPYA